MKDKYFRSDYDNASVRFSDGKAYLKLDGKSEEDVSKKTGTIFDDVMSGAKTITKEEYEAY